jgi:ABC-type transporter Mla subunit MlaD
MSQAVIDFCEGLKTTLLALEQQLGRAKRNLETGAAEASAETKKHLDDAIAQLESFKAHAGLMAQAIRADFPEQTGAMKEKLKDFSQEAQVAMRHAVVFLAEAASKGAEGAAEALQSSARQAHKVAEELKRDTAVAVVEPGQTAPPA